MCIEDKAIIERLEDENAKLMDENARLLTIIGDIAKQVMTGIKREAEVWQQQTNNHQRT